MMTKQYRARPRMGHRLERLILNAVPRHAAWIVALALVHGCGDVVGPAPTSSSQLSRSMTASAASTIAADGSQTFYGPEQFVRATGAPDQVTRVISTFGYAGPFVLHVQSGAADGSSRVTSGSVTLDGVTLLGPSDFNKKTGSWSIPVSLGQSATLQVQLQGKPGSYLTISLEGMVHTRFCPAATGDGFGYQTLQNALDSVAVGHTIWVCDGTHSVNEALVRKALTIRAEHPGLATLVQPSTAAPGDAILDINGTASGTNAVVDLALQFTQVGLHLHGTFDQASILRTSFSGPGLTCMSIPGVSTGDGLVSDSTTVATAHVVVDSSSFANSCVGLTSNQPVDFDTFRSTFTNTGSFGLIYYSSFGSRNSRIPTMRTGRVIGNHFTNCGTITYGVCVAIESVGVDTVSQNEMVITAGHGVVDGIYLNRAGFTAATAWATRPAIVTGNTIEGPPVAGPDSLVASWGIMNAIADQLNNTASTDVIQGNRISGALEGIVLRGGPAATDNVLASDNIIANTYVALFFPGHNFSLVAHRNDLTNYTYPMAASTSIFATTGLTAPTLPAGSITCNWWGSATGPIGVLPGTLSTAYTPFASTPIAGQPGVSCSP